MALIMNFYKGKQGGGVYDSLTYPIIYIYKKELLTFQIAILLKARFLKRQYIEMENFIEISVLAIAIFTPFVRVKKIHQLDLAFNNVKPKDWYFVLD